MSSSTNNCSCAHCKSDGSSVPADPSLTRQARFETRAAMLPLALDKEMMRRRMSQVHEFFTPRYLQAKGTRTYEELCSYAEGALRGEFQTRAKIRHYRGYAIKSHNMRDYINKPEMQFRRARLIEEAGEDKARHAFLENRALNLIEEYSLRCAQLDINREAIAHFQNLPYVINVYMRPTKSGNRAYFAHQSKEQTIPENQGHIILPLQHKIEKKWSLKSASEEMKDISNTPLIKGALPIHELLELNHESDLLHPTREEHLGDSIILIQLSANAGPVLSATT